MATQHTIEPCQAVHQAAAQLMEIDWIDQKTAKPISSLAEAIVNMATILFYQADTGLANKEDFLEARTELRKASLSHPPFSS
jgi:hypothetical protein